MQWVTNFPSSPVCESTELFLTNLPASSPMSAIKRFTSFSHAVDSLCETFDVDRRKATHLVWDFEMTIGTDRAIWLDFNRISKAV